MTDIPTPKELRVELEAEEKIDSIVNELAVQTVTKLRATYSIEFIDIRKVTMTSIKQKFKMIPATPASLTSIIQSKLETLFKEKNWKIETLSATTTKTQIDLRIKIYPDQ